MSSRKISLIAFMRHSSRRRATRSVIIPAVMQLQRMLNARTNSRAKSQTVTSRSIQGSRLFPKFRRGAILPGKSCGNNYQTAGNATASKMEGR